MLLFLISKVISDSKKYDVSVFKGGKMYGLVNDTVVKGYAAYRSDGL